MDDVNQPIIIKSKLELEDFVKIRMELLKTGKGSKFFKGLMIYIILLLFILLALSFVGNSPDVNHKGNEIMTNKEYVPLYISLLPTIFLVAILFFFFFVIKWLIKFSSRKHFQSNKLIQKEVTYTITYDGMDCISETSSAKVTWDELFKIVETKSAIVIFASNLTAWIIPKKNVAELDLNKFKVLALKKMPTKKVKLQK